MDTRENQYTDSTIGSYSSYIISDIPEVLKVAYSRNIGNDISSAIQNIVKEYLVEEKEANVMKYEIIGQPTSRDIDKLHKRQKYYAAGMVKSLEEDYASASAGKAVSNNISPFQELVVRTLVSVNKERSSAIDDIYSSAHQWLESYSSFRANSKRDEWIKENVGFCTYPYFYVIEAGDPNKAKKMIMLDLTDMIFRLSVESKYKRFSYYTPKSILREGFVDEGQRKDTKFRQSYDIDVLSNTTLRETFFSEDTQNISDISQTTIFARRTWDYKDVLILNYLCTKCIKETSDMNGVLSVSGNLTEICEVLFPDIANKKYSSKHYEIAKERLSNIFETRVSAKLGGKLLSKTIFEYSVISDPKDEKKEEDELDKGKEDGSSRKNRGATLFQANFGRRIAGDLLNSRIETIIRPQIDSIDSDIAKMLFMSLKNDRINDVFFYNQQTRVFSMDSFMIIVRLPDKKAKRMEKYSSALKELQDKNLLIESFTVNKDSFEIRWIPLSEQERKDIRVIPVVTQLPKEEVQLIEEKDGRDQKDKSISNRTGQTASKKTL